MLLRICSVTSDLTCQPDPVHKVPVNDSSERALTEARESHGGKLGNDRLEEKQNVLAVQDSDDGIRGFGARCLKPVSQCLVYVGQQFTHVLACPLSWLLLLTQSLSHRQPEHKQKIVKGQQQSCHQAL